MYLQANPSRARDEEEREEIRRKYTPGENVLPRIRRRRESNDQVEDRRMVEEVREMSLREVGIRGSESYERGVTHRVRDGARDARDEDARQRRRGTEGGPSNGGREEMARPSTATDAANQARRIGHQSSLRSLLSTSDLDSSEMEEEILRQIMDEGILDGIDLNSIDVGQEDELRVRIIELNGEEPLVRRGRGRIRMIEDSRGGQADLPTRLIRLRTLLIHQSRDHTYWRPILQDRNTGAGHPVRLGKLGDRLRQHPLHLAHGLLRRRRGKRHDQLRIYRIDRIVLMQQRGQLPIYRIDRIVLMQQRGQLPVFQADLQVLQPKGFAQGTTQVVHVSSTTFTPIKASQLQSTEDPFDESHVPLTFSTKCDICTYPIPPSTTRFHCPQCNDGDYDICTGCYLRLVKIGRISADNGPKGWRRCLNGHRMVVIGFEDSVQGQSRIVVEDLVGGHAPSNTTDSDGEVWSWRDESQQTQAKTMSNGVNSRSFNGSIPHPSDLVVGKYPPNGGVGMRVLALWSYWPQEGVEDELSFPKGAEIRECEDINGDWFLGIYCGRKGVFPGNYCRILDKVGM
ncbi:MAG: hypothetical protein ASARMPREDX12_004459 [Alectoria sarmentosa]|nr:MAG: hypothetical protein ASARMPREDX12_004459 [Alectoria sarmentosa]